MAVGTKKVGATLEIYFNGNKLANRKDSSIPLNGAQSIESGDADGPGRLVGQRTVDEWPVVVHYLDGDTNQQAIIDLAGDSTQTAQAIEVRPNGTASGRTKFTNTAMVLSVSPLAAPVNGMQELTINFALQGAWTRGTQA